MLTFLTIFFPAVMLVGVLALERMERQFNERAMPKRQVASTASTRADGT